MRLPRATRDGQPLAPAALQVLALAYVAFVLAMTLLPIQWSHELSRWPSHRRAQLVPVAPIVSAIMHDGRPLTTIAEVTGNVLMFMPLGCLLPLVLRRLDRVGRVLLAGLCASVLIEVSQLRMPGVRRADVNDVLANVAGAALGWLALVLVERWLAGNGKPTLRERARPDHAERIDL